MYAMICQPFEMHGFPGSNVYVASILYPKTPIDQRTCFHCVIAVEHKLHFFIECPFYEDMRRKLFHKAQLCNILILIAMNNISMQTIVASTFSMCQRRKSVL